MAPDDDVVALPLDAEVTAAIRVDVGLQDDSLGVARFAPGGRGGSADEGGGAPSGGVSRVMVLLEVALGQRSSWHSGVRRSGREIGE
jgi:hypothetical protein